MTWNGKVEDLLDWQMRLRVGTDQGTNSSTSAVLRHMLAAAEAEPKERQLRTPFFARLHRPDYIPHSCSRSLATQEVGAPRDIGDMRLLVGSHHCRPEASLESDPLRRRPEHSFTQRSTALAMGFAIQQTRLALVVGSHLLMRGPYADYARFDLMPSILERSIKAYVDGSEHRPGIPLDLDSWDAFGMGVHVKTEDAGPPHALEMVKPHDRRYECAIAEYLGGQVTRVTSIDAKSEKI